MSEETLWEWAKGGLLKSRGCCNLSLRMFHPEGI